jgi:hypothetical protein
MLCWHGLASQLACVRTLEWRGCVCACVSLCGHVCFVMSASFKYTGVCESVTACVRAQEWVLCDYVFFAQGSIRACACALVHAHQRTRVNPYACHMRSGIGEASVPTSDLISRATTQPRPPRVPTFHRTLLPLLCCRRCDVATALCQQRAARCGAMRCGAVRCGAVRCGARQVPALRADRAAAMRARRSEEGRRRRVVHRGARRAARAGGQLLLL